MNENYFDRCVSERKREENVFIPFKVNSKALQAIFYQSHVSAGFPSPASHYEERALDLNHYLVKNPAATFFIRVASDAMIYAGIYPHDLAIVDRSLMLCHQKIIVAVVNGEMMIRRYFKDQKRELLVPENPAYEVISILPQLDFEVWGVVTNVVHAL
jgi:DNA polymerase V